MHLNNLQATVSSAPLTADLSAQAARTEFTATGEVRFPDIDWADIQSKAPIDVPTPRSYRETLGIKGAGIVLAGPGGDAPSELVLEGITLDLKFSNAHCFPVIDFSLGMASLPAQLRPKLKLVSSDSEGGLYQVDPAFPDSLLNLIEINLDGPKFTRLFNDILKDYGKAQANPDDYNRLAVQVSVWLSSPDGTLAGSEFTFRFITKDGVLDWKN